MKGIIDPTGQISLILDGEKCLICYISSGLLYFDRCAEQITKHIRFGILMICLRDEMKDSSLDQSGGKGMSEKVLTTHK